MAKTNIIQGFYSLVDGVYTPDASGGVAGVTWKEGGIEYLAVNGNFNSFNMEERRAESIFKKFAKVGNQWAQLPSTIKVVDDSNYINGNPLSADFGKYEDNPYMPDGVTLKSDMLSEVQFFIDNIIQNKNNIPMGMAQFSWSTIKRIESL